MVVEGPRLRSVDYSVNAMRMAVVLVGLVMILSTFSMAAFSGSTDKDPFMKGSDEYVPGEILVILKDKASKDDVKKAKSNLKVKDAKTLGKTGIDSWKLGEDVSVKDALKELKKSGYKDVVDIAEPNYYVYADTDPVLTDDLYRGHLWGMHNGGQTGGTADCDIDMLETWQTDTDAPSIVVAVIDTGVDYNHEDLSSNIWTNAGDPVGNGDEDGNGYVDDWCGWDFVNNDNDPMDDNGHGTHCSGTIGAIGDNGKGVAGVCWNVKIMPLKFLNAGGRGTTDNAILAVDYAASFDAVKITSNSWGGGRKSKTLETAIKNSGQLFVASAGNSGSSRLQYPAGYKLDNIISVAATDHDDDLASFSNYGDTWVDLGAPGVNILSCLPGDNYGFKGGTSMACPHVSGVAALLWENTGYNTVSEVKGRILNTVDSISSLSSVTVSGGRLNAQSALGVDFTATDTVTPENIGSFSTSNPDLDAIDVTWGATNDDTSIDVAYYYDLRYSTSAITTTNWDSCTQIELEPAPTVITGSGTVTFTGLVDDTTYYFGIIAYDESGKSTSLATTSGKTLAETSDFTRTQVDPSAGHCMYHSFAFDHDGNPTVAYCDVTNDKVKFNKMSSGGDWGTPVTIDTADCFVSLAYNNDGRPCITYGSGTLMYTEYDGTKWTKTQLESRKVSPWDKSLAFDSSGDPGIAYYLGGPKGGCMYIHYDSTSGSWSKEVVSSGAKPIYTSLQYNPTNGHPAIAFCDNSAKYLVDRLKYAMWDGNAWQVEEAAGHTGTFFGVQCDLIFDNGKPKICAWDTDRDTGGVFIFYQDANGDWTSECVDSTYHGDGTSMCISSDGNIYVSYELPGKMRVASKEGSIWTSAYVQKTSGIHTSIQVYTSGDDEVVGLTYTNGDLLMYATDSY
jgi:subtilisin family serine protease